MQCTSVVALAVERERAMTAQRIVRELEVVALADEEPERLLQVPGRLRHSRKAPLQQRRRGAELVVLVVVRQRLRNLRPVDPELPQPALDPLAAPAVEIAPVLGKTSREARIVDVPALPQLAEHLLDQPGLNVVALEPRDQLGLGALPVREKTPRRLARLLAQLVRARRGLRAGHKTGPPLGPVFARGHRCGPRRRRQGPRQPPGLPRSAPRGPG